MPHSCTRGRSEEQPMRRNSQPKKLSDFSATFLLDCTRNQRNDFAICRCRRGLRATEGPEARRTRGRGCTRALGGGGEPQGRGTGGGGLWHVKTGLLSVQQTADSTGCKRKKNSLQLWAALFDRRGEESSVISPSHTNTHARARTQYR